MRNLVSKKMNKKGFTLMEMLIVIAIIAILVGIAIPTFGGALKKAKYGADTANVRAWYAEQQISLMTENSYSVPTFDNTKLQLEGDGAKVTSVGTTAETFKVTYDPNGDVADDPNYPSVVFGN